MKILAEEIVKGSDNRYRRQTLGVFDCPEELLAVVTDGHFLTVGDSNKRRLLVVANVRVATLHSDGSHIGLIVDLISPELCHALKNDESAPADYEAFCKLEGVEP